MLLLFMIVERFYAMAQSDSLSSCDSLPNALSPLMVDDLASQQLIFQDTLPHYVPLSVADTLKRYTPGAYDLPYSVTGKAYDWHRLWINTSALSSAFVGTLLVLQCLPEDATSWNRAELQDVPLFKRWRNHVLKKGPEWDHDKFYFNYILHPYAGAVYYMAARSCGFNAWQSLLYCSLVSTVGWEFGIEAFMERPSYQDLLITPIVGSLIGEGFYKAKRSIVNNDYRLLGSSLLGNIVVFIIDPVNEVLGLLTGNPARETAKRKSTDVTVASSLIVPNHKSFRFGLSLVITI